MAQQNASPNAPLHLRALVFVSFFAGMAACGSAAAQMVPSSLDETLNITSSRSVKAPTLPTSLTALPEDISKIRIEPGLVLGMSVFNAPEMTHSLAVDDDGDVVVPLAGLVHVEGDSIREAERKIAAALVAKQMMNTPDVSLQVTAYSPRSVLVAGEVQQPGKVQLLAPRPVLEVIATAGGVTTAAGGDIEIRHLTGAGQEDVRHIRYANGKEPSEAQTALVYPGDTIFVRRAGVIYVLGAVARPGGYLMANGGKLTLPQAIAAALGTTLVAAESNTVVVRKNGDALVQFRVRLDREEHGRIAPLELQDGDMIYVPTSKLKYTLVNSSVILSSAASAAIYAGFNN